MGERTAHSRTKKGLFIVMMTLLFLPIIQQVLHPFNVRPLNGAQVSAERTQFSFSSWTDGDYQVRTNNYLNENFGFRSFCVRLYNQIYFSLFNEARANKVVIGKQGYLYEQPYIDAYYGRDFLGKETIDDRAARFAQMRDSLLTRNVNIAVIFAPGKAAFYPEFIPDKYQSELTEKTNLNYYKTSFDSLQIDYLDLHSWFIKQKSRSLYPLYPKGGTHWSRYGEVLAGDTILKYVSSLKNVPLPKIVIDSINLSKSMKFRDDDIEAGMNLLFDLEDSEMAYPYIHFEPEKSVDGPKVLVVGDSYYWGIHNIRITEDIFNNGQFWYYNKLIYPERVTLNNEVKNINVAEAVAKFDLILIMATDASLSSFPYDFTDRLYRAYVEGFSEPEAELSYEERMEFYIQAIKNTAVWLEKVKKQASENGQSLEKTMQDEAAYMIWKEDSE